MDYFWFCKVEILKHPILYPHTKTILCQRKFGQREKGRQHFQNKKLWEQWFGSRGDVAAIISDFIKPYYVNLK